jgi:hypothetical protein
MPTPAPTKLVLFTALPGSSQLHIFQLVCDSCPPDTPGTCWLAPVCQAWRSLARSVKGLRVVFCSEEKKQAASFCAWLRRHAPQVVALAVTSLSGTPQQVLATLAQEAAAAAAAADDGNGQLPVAAETAVTLPSPSPPPPAAAAAAGTALPLRRLAIINARLLNTLWCQFVLTPLLAALRHLQHLHLSLAAPDHSIPPEAASLVGATVLAPLQHSTALTSLVLEGPSCGYGDVTDEAYEQVLAGLPPTLRSLEWRQVHMYDPRGLSFDHLTGLTRLRLCTLEPGILDADIPGDAFTALTQLRRLELYGVIMSDQGLLAHKERLVGLDLQDGSTVLSQLTHLQTLDLMYSAPIEDLLPQAPALRELSVLLEYREWSEEMEEEGEGEEGGDTSCAWSSPWPLQQYGGLSRLERLAVGYRDFPLLGPLGLCSLTQLKQLSLSFGVRDPSDTGARVSWAAALAGLVDLEVLSVPGFMVDCWHHCLTRLTRLVVLEVTDIDSIRHMPAAAAHISQLLAPAQGRSRCSSSQRAPPGQGPAEQIRVVCLQRRRFLLSGSTQNAARLRRALVAAVPVLPPNTHLFRGTWGELQACGVELWPEPVAARLQQLELQ